MILWYVVLPNESDFRPGCVTVNVDDWSFYRIVIKKKSLWNDQMFWLFYIITGYFIESPHFLVNVGNVEF